MSYTIKKSDGTTLATVPENEIILDKASVALVGRGATNYGVSHSENFVRLLENFAHTTPPVHALEGQLWYDKAVDSMKVYNGAQWTQLGGGGGGTGADGAGIVYVGLVNGSALALVAGGQVIAALSSVDVAQVDLPETIQFLDAALTFRALFPGGLQAGQTLATVAADYVYQGHVPIADQALYAGGGTPLAATTFLDLGDASITLTVAGNQIIFASSSAIIPAVALPANVNVAGQVIPLSSVFPSGLAAGITFATGFGISIAGGSITGGGTGVGGDGSGSSLTIQVMEQYVNGQISTSLASAKTEWFAEADELYATASVTTEIVSSFTTATGQTTLAEAVDWLLTTATEGTGSAEAGTLIRTEITNAITGATTFSEALNLLNSSVTATSANASSLNALTAEITTGTGATSVANISDRLTVIANTATAASTLSTTLDSTFKSATGETTTAAAINKLWTQANATGSVAGWGVKVEAGGLVSGIELLADTSQNVSSFKVLANNFKIVHPNTPEVTPFEVKDNITYIKTLMIGNGELGFEKLKPLSFTPQVYRGFSYTIRENVNAALHSGAMTISTGLVPRGSRVVIYFSGNISGSDNDGAFITVQRSISGGTTTTLQGSAEFGCPDSGGSAQTWIWSDTISADGTYSYTMWGRAFGGGVNLRSAHLIGLVQKQFEASAISPTAPATSGDGTGGGGGIDLGGGGFIINIA